MQLFKTEKEWTLTIRKDYTLTLVYKRRERGERIHLGGCYGGALLFSFCWSHSFSRSSAKRSTSRTEMPVPRSMSCFVPALCLLRMCMMAAASLPYVFAQKKQLKSFWIRVATRRTVLYFRGPFLPAILSPDVIFYKVEIEPRFVSGLFKGLSLKNGCDYCLLKSFNPRLLQLNFILFNSSKSAATSSLPEISTDSRSEYARLRFVVWGSWFCGVKYLRVPAWSTLDYKRWS